jgi:hypothetical protein
MNVAKGTQSDLSYPAAKENPALLKVKAEEERKWWSIGRGRKDSKEKEKIKGKENKISTTTKRKSILLIFAQLASTQLRSLSLVPENTVKIIDQSKSRQISDQFLPSELTMQKSSRTIETNSGPSGLFQLT